MSVQFDSTPPVLDDATNIAVTLGVGSLGGTIGVRIIIDDAVITSRAQAKLMIDNINDSILERTWPVS